MADQRFDPTVRHRRSLRLARYDYGAAGGYFVTVVTQQRLPLFGKVVDTYVHHTPAGEMVLDWWQRLPAKFPTLALDALVLMPNHLHAIIMLTDARVGAIPRDRPSPAGPNDLTVPQPENANSPPGQGQARGPAPTEPTGATTLPAVMRWFKTMTTNAYFQGVRTGAWPPVPGRLWQRNYYEHVIRNDAGLDCIREYIAANPDRWSEDTENPATARLP